MVRGEGWGEEPITESYFHLRTFKGQGFDADGRKAWSVPRKKKSCGREAVGSGVPGGEV